ncbi:hypothetical protein [Halanaerobium kushneri]|jgi:hypothetical protein|uniref:Uncharacterized protein n=1 Tax=Halanaerobium kushneri TaxID=56779 RepID=A0A1N6YTY9_9FIRM|nr:hypothetical protein [Halanaerobium kushneri]SIR18060.1 hypothetical protein SAMN05421834_11555 [Halanaerobium kushneri]
MSKKAEKMDNLFDERANSYDEHMRNNVVNFEEFYKSIASPISRTD